MWLAFWLIFVAVLLLALFYAWGIRGWGPPPAGGGGTRTRRGAGGAEVVGVEQPTRTGWGVLGPWFWAAVAVAVVWLILGLAL